MKIEQLFITREGETEANVRTHSDQHEFPVKKHNNYL